MPAGENPSETGSATEQPDTGTGSGRETQTGSSRRAFLARSAGAASAVGLAHLGVVGGAAADPGIRTDSGSETTTESGTGTSDAEGQTTTFTVRVENVSDETTLETSAQGDAMKQAVPLSPGAYAVHSEPGPLFSAGEPAPDNGLEALAEDGNPMALADSLGDRMDVSDGGAFATPVGGDGPAPIGPDGAYEFSVEASPGQRLSLATMFVQSNDLFYAPEPRGIGLFDGEEPLSGDVTNALGLWDASTEQNEEPGVGENQAPRQMDADTGPSEDAPVRLVTDVGDGYSYPYVSDVIRVTRTPEMG